MAAGGTWENDRVVVLNCHRLTVNMVNLNSLIFAELSKI